MSPFVSWKTGVLLAVVFTLGLGFGRVHLAPAAEEKKHIVDIVVDEGDPEIGRLVAKERAAALKADPRGLAKDQVDAARQALEARYKEFRDGRSTLDAVMKSGQRLLDAEVALAPNDEARLACFERMWKLALAIELMTQARFNAGRVPAHELSEAKYARLEAHKRWLDAKVTADKKK